MLGGGSNVVVGDAGFDGTVLVVATRGIERLPGAAHATGGPPASAADRLRGLERSLRPAQQREEVRVRVQAGEPWDDLCAEAVRQGWSGIEALSGVPGSLRRGTDPEHRRVRAGARRDARGRRVPGPRHRHRATAARLRAAPGLPDQRVQAGRRGRRARGRAAAAPRGRRRAGAQLAGRLRAARRRARRARSAAACRSRRSATRVLELRRSKGMVLDDRDPESVSVGSFFTNPIVSERFARTLPARRAALADLPGRRARRRRAARCRAAPAPDARRRAAGQAVRGVADPARRRRSAASASPGPTRTSRGSTRSRS